MECDKQPKDEMFFNTTSVEVYWFARVIRVFDLIVEVPKRVGKDQIFKNFYLI